MEQIAQVYARSLFEVAQEQDKLDLVREQLGQIDDAIPENREMRLFLFSPYFSTEEKREGLRRAIEGADPAISTSSTLLLENHRLPLITRLRREYDRRWDLANDLLPVTVTSAVELDDAVVQRIGDEIGSRPDSASSSPSRSTRRSSAASSCASATRSSTPPSATA